MKIGFTAQTEANAAQDIIDQSLGKRKRGVFGPAFGQRMVLFIDDINMPRWKNMEHSLDGVDEAVCDQGGWYDNKEKALAKWLTANWLLPCFLLGVQQSYYTTHDEVVQCPLRRFLRN